MTTIIRLPPVAIAFAFALPTAAQCQADARPELVVRVVGHYDNAVGISNVASQGVITADLIACRPVGVW